MMRRFFVPPEGFSEGKVILRGQDVLHMRNVLRLREGDNIHVLDGKGHRYCVRLTRLKRHEVLGDILSTEPIQNESPITIRMGQVLIKGNKFDGIIRKAVELGVNSIAPLKTDRCVLKILRTDESKKIERWQKIAGEASKQCGRTAIPTMDKNIRSLEEFCDSCQEYDLKIAFWEDEESTRLKKFFERETPHSIAFLVGPEGGLTQPEIDIMRRHGFHTVTLGPRKLRAETVALTVLSLLQNRWGDL